jgi:hypothetical protein
MAIKLGAEDKKKVYMASGLGVIMLGVAVWFVNSFVLTPTPAAPVPATQATPSARGPAAPVTAKTGRSSGTHEAEKIASAANNLDPTLHPELMAAAESLKYTGNGRNIFSLNSVPVAIPAAEKSARNTPPPVQPTGPLPPAPPPAIDLKFFGYSTRQSGIRRAFLLKGDDVFIASEGDVVDHRYKVVKIAPTSVQVEDIPYANTQSLPLVQN